MKIDKNQILELLRSEGKAAQADQAEKDLPDQVDTDNEQHAALLSKFGIDLNEIAGKLGGLGNIF
jgi:hypothetical protein